MSSRNNLTFVVFDLGFDLYTLSFYKLLSLPDPDSELDINQDANSIPDPDEKPIDKDELNENIDNLLSKIEAGLHKLHLPLFARKIGRNENIKDVWDLLWDTLDSLNPLIYEKYGNYRSHVFDIGWMCASYGFYFIDEPTDEELRKGLDTRKKRLDEMHNKIFHSKTCATYKEFLANPTDDNLTDYKQMVCSQNDIFIIHGHDDGPKEYLARYLMELGHKPIILSERPNEGKTIHEKLLEYSHSAGYAFVLLTPDDYYIENFEKKILKKRARQNVIFEMGLFVGVLGPERVCLLIKGDVDLPSDINGVVYYKITEFNAIKNQIKAELEKVGYITEYE